MTRFIKHLWNDLTFKYFSGCQLRNPIVVDDLVTICFGEWEPGLPAQKEFSEEFKEWKENTLQGKCYFRLWSNTAYFSREEDAMVFKLRYT